MRRTRAWCAERMRAEPANRPTIARCAAFISKQSVSHARRGHGIALEVPPGWDEGDMSANTVVLVLNANGNRELYCGWRAEEIFRGEWDATPEAIAVAASRELGARLQVHAQMSDDEARYVVLRWSTAYSWTAHAAPRAIAAVPKQPQPRPRAAFAEREERTGIRSRAKLGHESGTFVCEDVERMTAAERAKRIA